MKKYIFIISILTLLLISACNIDFEDLAENVDEETAAKLSDAVVKCDDPYIRHGSECCLDQNANAICDEDESIGVPDVVDEAIDDAVDDALEDAIDAGDLDLAPDAEPEPACTNADDCAPAFDCFAGVCEQIDFEESCYESDGSNNYEVYGQVTVVDSNGEATIYSDECYVREDGMHMILEQRCSVGNIQELDATCGDGNTCVDGACIL